MWRSLIKKWMNLTGIGSTADLWRTIREPFSGAWQKNIKADRSETLLTYSAVFACVTGIATDIAKLRIKLCENKDGIWEETKKNSPFLPVLRKPNHYQTRIKFIEQWTLSKLLHGNTYVLKQRDNRGIVTALYVLAPQLVTPLVSDDGSVFYRLQRDNLSKQPGDSLTVPASEIIHDTMCCLYHPLCGIAPLTACAISATLGNRIQSSSTFFFNNRAIPGGVLTAPGSISDPTAKRLKEEFEKNYSGENMGRLLVLGDGLEFKLMQMTAEQSQVAEQLGWVVEDIARAFHYPMFKLGGPLPAYAGNVEAAITSYYTDCLQEKIESMELLLDEGLDLPTGMGTELDLENLMRMDTAGLYQTNTVAVGGGWMAPNEARFKANMPPVAGGSTPYLQQQNYSLAALAKRDATDDPFGTKPKPDPAPAETPEPDPPNDEPPNDEPPAKMYFGVNDIFAHSTKGIEAMNYATN